MMLIAVRDACVCRAGRRSKRVEMRGARIVRPPWPCGCQRTFSSHGEGVRRPCTLPTRTGIPLEDSIARATRHASMRFDATIRNTAQRSGSPMSRSRRRVRVATVSWRSRCSSGDGRFLEPRRAEALERFRWGDRLRLGERFRWVEAFLRGCRLRGDFAAEDLARAGRAISWGRDQRGKGRRRLKGLRERRGQASLLLPAAPRPGRRIRGERRPVERSRECVTIRRARPRGRRERRGPPGRRLPRRARGPDPDRAGPPERSSSCRGSEGRGRRSVAWRPCYRPWMTAR